MMKCETFEQELEQAAYAQTDSLSVEGTVHAAECGDCRRLLTESRADWQELATAVDAWRLAVPAPLLGVDAQLQAISSAMPGRTLVATNDQAASNGRQSPSRRHNSGYVAVVSCLSIAAAIGLLTVTDWWFPWDSFHAGNAQQESVSQQGGLPNGQVSAGSVVDRSFSEGKLVTMAAAEWTSGLSIGGELPAALDLTPSLTNVRALIPSLPDLKSSSNQLADQIGSDLSRQLDHAKEEIPPVWREVGKALAFLQGTLSGQPGA